MSIYLLINGIDGDVTAAGHAGWIEVSSFSWGVSNPVAVSSGAGGASSGKPSFSEVEISHNFGLGSPLLAQDCVLGKVILSAEIDVTVNNRGVETTYLKIKLTEVFVSSYQVSGDTGGTPSESVTFYFEKLEMIYSTLPPSLPITQDVLFTREATGD